MASFLFQVTLSEQIERDEDHDDTHAVQPKNSGATSGPTNSRILQLPASEYGLCTHLRRVENSIKSMNIAGIENTRASVACEASHANCRP